MFEKYISTSFKILFVSLLCFNVQLAYAKDGVIYKTKSGINFVNGGIGEEQAKSIRSSAKNFSLHLLFSEGSYGGWLTDVSVLIIDGNGKTAFSKRRSGPILYIDLPPGDYQVIGRYNDEKQSVHVTLTGEKPQKVILNWKNDTGVIEDSSKEEQTNITQP